MTLAPRCGSRRRPARRCRPSTWCEAGVDVVVHCEPGLVHSFLQLDEISPARAAAADQLAAEVGDRSRAA